MGVTLTPCEGWTGRLVPGGAGESVVHDVPEGGDGFFFAVELVFEEASVIQFGG